MASDKVNKVKDQTVMDRAPAAKTKSAFREYAEAIIMALILALFIRTFIVQAFKIPSGSMIPTLEIGDHILVNKLTYGVRIPFLERYLLQYATPQRGDVVVFIYPEDRSKDFIKRVLGLPGEQVRISDGTVMIDGKRIEEPYIKYHASYDFDTRTVPPRQYFVLGDNRDTSADSRFFRMQPNQRASTNWIGFVPRKNIVGRSSRVVISLNYDNHYIPRWNRFFRPMP